MRARVCWINERKENRSVGGGGVAIVRPSGERVISSQTRTAAATRLAVVSRKK